jgi:acetyltransferase-like isoleucine patch superfamily enzyme
MIILKIYFHVNATVKLIFYKILYKKAFCFGKKFTFRKGFSIAIEKSGSIIIGNNCFFNNYCSLTSVEKICIGDDTIFGEGVKIYDHNHIFYNKEVPIKFQGNSTAAVTIGSRCWIASNVVILKGVSIGDNCVIGAGCIIHKNVPNDSIVMNEQNQIIKFF